jgi:uncharacterized membrane protein
VGRSRRRPGVTTASVGYGRGVRFSLILLLGGLAVAAIIFAATGGHVLLLPFLFVLPLGLFGFGRRRDRR